jgi:hypothetical protein
VDATSSSLTLTNVQFSQQGIYSVNVTNAAGSVTSSNALLTVVYPPATVQVASLSNAPSGGSVTVPVLLMANGNENGLGFSVSFAPSLLSLENVGLGTGAAGASLLINTNQIGFGKLGVAVALPAGQTWAAGIQDVVDIAFTVGIVTNPTVASISFNDQPITRELSDGSGNPLAATYQNGLVAIAAAALEGDVWPRANGDEALTISDWVLVGRYAAGLDSPTNGSEFQRADCAPRSTLGDGQITVIDWVQTGRYAAGLDPLTVAGGPTNALGDVKPLGLPPSTPHKLSGGTRELLVTSSVLLSGQNAAVSVDLVAQGDENALGFSLVYDPTLASVVGVSAGANAKGATFDINTNQGSAGRVGVVLALPVGTTFPAGTQELARLSFQSTSTNTATSPLVFGDAPVVRQVSDPTATPLAANYLNTSISINPVPVLSISHTGQNVSLSWPAWATNFVLQTSDELGAFAAWSNTTVSMSVTNGMGVTTVPVSGRAKFYRLLHP